MLIKAMMFASETIEPMEAIEDIQRSFLRVVKDVMFNEDGLSFIGKASVVIFSIVLAFFVIFLLEKIFNSKILSKAKLGRNDTKVKTIGSIFKSFIKVFVFGFTTLFILDFLGFNTRSLLAVAGIGGVAVAFAAQSIVSDVITGAFILFENQYNVGDLVTVEGLEGTVVDMGLRVVKIKDITGAIHIIPNGNISTVTNHNKGAMRVLVDLLIPLDIKYEDVKGIMEQVINKLYEESILYETKPEILGISAYDSLGYTVQVISSSKSGNQWEAQRLLRQYMLEAFRENKMNDFLEDEKDRILFEKE